jgi:hypothetical protein
MITKAILIALLLVTSSATAGLYPQRGLFNMICAKDASVMFSALEEKVGERIAYHGVLQSTEEVGFSMWITENKKNKTISVIITRTTPSGSETCMVWSGIEIIPIDNPPIESMEKSDA